LKSVRRNEFGPIMWVTDDASILNRWGNAVCEREVVVHRFETDNGTDKIYRPFLGATFEKEISV